MANRIYLCLAHMSDAGLEQKYIKEAFDTKGGRNGSWLRVHGDRLRVHGCFPLPFTS